MTSVGAELFPGGCMYALVLEADGYDVLIDPRDLWKPPRVLVRRGWLEAEVWLDDVSFRRPGKFGEREEKRILALVRENQDDLMEAWFHLKDDVRRDRLDRNVLVD
jgi:uncharacterized protein DUF4160